MRRGVMAVAVAAALAASAGSAQIARVTDDPHIWLEDREGAAPLAWVDTENKRTLARLEADPRYETFYREALAIAAAEDRIPMPQMIGGRIFNLWRDKARPQGIWRVTSAADFASANPNWTTLIDLDALSKAEGRQWVWKGVTCLEPDHRRCLVALSEGGEDATSLREFDLEKGAFVEGGFDLPASKQNADWIDADTLIVSRDWGEGTLTKSGYPFVVKILKRGQPLGGAREIYRGTPDDIGAWPSVEVDAQGNRATVITRAKTFFTSDILLWDGTKAQKVPLPDRVDVNGLVDGRLVVRTSEAWGKVPEGALASLPLQDATRGKGALTTIFAPGPRQSVDRGNVRVTGGAVIASVYDNVRGRAMVFTPAGDGWAGRTLSLPDNLSVDLVTAEQNGDRGYLAVSGFTTPTRLMAFDAAGTEAPVAVKSSPARFDATGLVVEQFEATSSDGTKVPYFVVHREGAAKDGSTPTLMTAYGGFEVSNTPYYSGITGKLWLERGGAFVLANIRGGGEFGPAWHEAGRKTKRQLIFDDFASIARDLFARGITSAPKLGIYGGSNGGLLMGVQLTQHPELWGAVTIQVPLLDMLRYEGIAAGASWVDEYGSVSVPEERAFLATMSPYHALRKDGRYPEPYIWTTTKDDRVGPQHARKFAARMKEFGLPYLFYEDMAGGHSGDADIAQGARLQALQTVYFAQKLIGPSSK
ncbi:prolyl oligopeptidase family serine peptidase [Sphingomonas mucosissima]|uniref:Prolyl endopeptidase n=1 Tax=Sphingomonas mucosissima TaxID=370959 RepID=A0A245ZG21_9SPHN|nr:prolyl oligopeptidase family serine peptidase [Sphingomonas mucosissima]OWK28707.1 prolyl endopeptidase [Sphingomonas mucosissima]